MRPYLDSHGSSWPFKQIGENKVRVGAELIPRMYHGYQVQGPNGNFIGPREYLTLNKDVEGVFTSKPQQRIVRYLKLRIKLLPRLCHDYINIGCMASLLD